MRDLRCTETRQPTISTFSAEDIARNVRELGALMHACVHAGASIGYILPYSEDDGEAFWTKKVQPAVADGTRLLLVARKAGKIVGSVQLDIDTPPNQPHRAEVRKLMVHPDFPPPGYRAGADGGCRAAGERA